MVVDVQRTKERKTNGRDDDVDVGVIIKKTFYSILDDFFCFSHSCDVQRFTRTSDFS